MVMREFFTRHTLQGNLHHTDPKELNEMTKFNMTYDGQGLHSARNYIFRIAIF